MERLARAGARAVDALAIATFTGMFACVLVQVVLRYVFDRPLTWSDELARYLLVWCSFLGWIVAARRRSHLAIGLLPSKVGPRAGAALALLAALASVAFCAVLLAYGMQMTRRNVDVDTVALFFPFAVVYAAVPVASLAVALHALADVARAVRALRGEAAR